MKTMKELLDESRERDKTRFAERKEIESRSLSVRLEVGRTNEEIGQHAMGTVTSEALATAERTVGKVDSAIERLEHLRLDLIQIAVGDRWHQVEHPPQMDDLARELGELAALLHVREVLARTEVE